MHVKEVTKVSSQYSNTYGIQFEIWSVTRFSIKIIYQNKNSWKNISSSPYNKL